MKWSAGAVGSAIEKDLRHLQMLLPFPDEKTIDMKRCRSILHVCSWVVRRLSATPLKPGSDETCLIAYNTMPYAPLRIDYDSLVRFLDAVRQRHAIPDRRPPAIWGRHRDENLLPFPWTDTMTVREVADVLNIHASKVLLRIEAGEFEAYQFAAFASWRISRNSLAKHIERFGSAAARARPYAASTIDNVGER